jgi:hypothetical protein
MRFKNGAGVYSFDGQVVGTVGRAILSPKTKDVTHIVVRKGSTVSEDKIIPLHLVASTSADRVLLCADAGELDTLPPFEQARYIWYPSLSAWIGYPGDVGLAASHCEQTEAEQNIPEGAIALNEVDAGH